MYTKKNGRMTYKSNRRPNFKRNNNYSSKGRNKGNVTQQYNKYLKLAKDTFSAGDRIQAEYYYQFTDHYYRLMQELGINIDAHHTSAELQDESSTNTISENDKNEKLNLDDNLNSNNNDGNNNDDHHHEEEDNGDSIEAIPFISEPVKKKRTRSSK